MKMEFRIYFAMIFLLFVVMALIIVEGVTGPKKCEDAGGVYVSRNVCVNPTAIIEVN